MNVASLSLFVKVLMLGILLSSCREDMEPRIQRVDLGMSEGESLRSVEIFPSGGGLVVGGLRFDQERIFYTNDGGESWEASRLNFDFGKIIYDILWLNDSLLFASGMDGKVLRSQDAGRHWSQLGQVDWWPAFGIAAATDSIMLVVGGVSYGLGFIWRSADQGKTWTKVEDLEFELRDITFLDNGMGFACGYGAIMKSVDYGQTWTYTSAQNEFFASMHFPDESVGYVVGRTGTILKTEDKGLNWEVLRNGNTHLLNRQSYNDVFFESENVGYIVGDQGIFRYTTDGGKTWKNFSWEEKENLYGISQDGEGRLWVVGSHGGLWKISP